MVLPGDRRRSGAGRIAHAARLAREARWAQESADAAREAELASGEAVDPSAGPAAPAADVVAGDE